MNTGIVTDIEIANNHANALQQNDLSFHPKDKFDYSKSSASEQLTEVLEQLEACITDFSELTAQNSAGIKTVANSHQKVTAQQADRWR